MSDVKVFYLKNKANKSVGCVAWQMHDENSVQFNVSVCAKQDTFRKSIGRKIAIGRMQGSKTHILKIYDKNVMKQIMQYLSGSFMSKHFPQQAVDAARYWLIKG